MLTIKKYIFNPFLENTYIVSDDESKEAAIIDPGCYDDKERELLSNFITSKQLRIKYLVNTHCHIDHIFGNSFIKEKYNPIFLAPEEDLFLLDLMVEQANIYGTQLTPSPKPDEMISDGKEIFIGSSSGKFLFTPGHSPGEFCIYFEKEKICFTGDALFNGSIGRTDLWGGDYNTLINSITNKLFVLSDDVKIYPGHESESTIGYEKANNPFFREN
ncbi:MAG: MBL fold metallo-hydrolase [Melioribacteraceae bacterium]|jgi:glyoxylase-like metal-dependent hydrolase (beta-lactamase superfamily II)|nr:MBL fold metallo-hydrolase [Melioribacteraceae bacterium]